MIDAFERNNIELFELHTHSDEEIALKVNKTEREIAQFRKEHLASLELPAPMPLNPTSKVLATGLQPLNDILNGGLKRGSVTELFGSSGAGKTCLCCQIALQNANTVFITSENPPFIIQNRMEDIIAATHDNHSIMSTIKFYRVKSAQNLRVMLNAFVHQNLQTPLIIIDSITPVISTDEDVFSTLHEINLRKIAQKLNCAILITNQVRDVKRFNSDQSLKNLYQFGYQIELVEGDASPNEEFRKRPACGLSVAEHVDAILMLLRPSGNKRAIEILHSKYDAYGKCELTMGEGGLF